MSFILGFGSTENQVREQIKAAIISGVREGKSIDDVIAEWNAPLDGYDKMPRETAPERYTRVWFYGGALHFHHYNRRHAFSPDGWALWAIEEPFNEEYVQTKIEEEQQ